MSHELRFERVFDAAREDVFDAFVDREGQREMYGLDDPGWIVRLEGELRVGGVLTVAFGPAPGELYRHQNLFQVIDRPRRVSFITTEISPDGSSFDIDVEVTFQDQDGKTLMTMVQSGFPTTELRDLHEVGLPNAFDRVARFVRAKEANR